MINCTSEPIILPNTKTIEQTTSEKFHSQSETGLTNKRTNKRTGHKNHYNFIEYN